MKQVMDMLKINEEIDRKFFEVETALESACSPAELLVILLQQLGTVFDIPYIWLTFVKRQGEEGLLSNLAMPEYLREQVGELDEVPLMRFFHRKSLFWPMRIYASFINCFPRTGNTS